MTGDAMDETTNQPAGDNTPRQPLGATWESETRPSLQRPGRWRELFAVGALGVLANGLAFHGGWMGTAVLLVAAVPLLAIATPRAMSIHPAERAGWPHRAFVLLLIAAVAVRMAWLGTIPLALASVVVAAAVALTLAGRRPFLLDAVLATLLSLISSLLALFWFRNLLRSETDDTPPTASATDARPASWRLPTVAGVVFAAIFIMANPDLKTLVYESLERFSTSLGDVVARIVPGPDDIIVTLFVAAIALGLARPIVQRSLLSDAKSAAASEPRPAALFGEFRNTLVVVTGLFAVYLVFEFATLWRREFPPGFYYAGYAHAGAAWLTGALALASGLLSAMFRGRTLDDPRLPTLKRLAYVWSAENLLLAAAVVNRLLIYVDFNGLSPMRMVGFLGIAAVVGGLLLVVVKIARHHSLVWLLRRDLWTVSLAGLAYLVLPIDWIVHSYNAARIAEGDLAPSVQLSVQPMDAGGLLAIVPLLDHDDERITDGVAAMLSTAEANLDDADPDWRRRQLAVETLRDRLKSTKPKWDRFFGENAIRSARDRFDAFTYQWY